MNIEIKNNVIVLDKTPNNLDKFVIAFLKNLKNIKYVIVSGYVSILLGRTRTTEDVDLIIDKLNFKKFKELCVKLTKAGFETVNVDDKNELFDLLETGHGIRFCKKGRYIPNMEVKFAKNILEKTAITTPLIVKMGKYVLNISQLELQIAYKLYLGKEGNEKDIEDARYLYKLFSNYLNKQKLNEWLKQFNVSKMVKYLE